MPAEVISADPFVNLTASKMNVVYVGFPNPLNLRSTGIDLNDLTLIASPPGYITQHEKEYELNVSAVGIQMVKVLNKGILINEFTFRAKSIPDPVAKLGGISSGKMGAGQFKAQRGLFAMLDNFDFDVRCMITGFSVTRHALEEDRQTETNKGGNIEGKSNQLMLKAEPKDIYTFTDVRAKCPGDKANRTLNSLVFEIR